jgi:predicted glutamine amidotransferase
MCRLLAIMSESLINPLKFLQEFAKVCKNSKEYQGHGWGCAYYTNDGWQMYKNINPIWEDDFSQIPVSTKFLVHARSAFRDEGIEIENNMPFIDSNTVFIFNGELRGVKVKSQGRIGAEKLFNFILKLNEVTHSLPSALIKAADIIENRSEYVRAMNTIIVRDNNLLVLNKYNEDPNYHDLYILNNETDGERFVIVCSEKLKSIDNWEKVLDLTKEGYLEVIV